MNIVIINHYAGAPNFGMEFRPYYLAKGWTKLGHNVLIIGASFSHLRFNQPEVKGKISFELIDGLKYVWIKVNAYRGNGLGRIQSMVRFIFGLFFFQRKIFYDFIPDVIIASSTYPMDIFPSYKFSKKYNAKLCYEIHDLWPLSLMELGGYSRHHPFIMLVQWAEDFAYKNVDFVVSMLPKPKDYMVSRGLDPCKFFYIPNGISPEEWNNDIELPKEHQNLLNSLRKKYGFLVGYAGGHSLSNSLDSLIKSGELLHNTIAIVLVGDGIDKEKLQKIPNEQSKRNIYFLPTISKKCIPRLLSNFDALFIGAQRQSLYRFGISPNKMIDYMMSGKPIIQAIEAGNNMVEDHNCGIAVEPENPIAIAQGIARINEMTESERKKMGQNGQEAALKFHDYKVLCDNFIVAANSVTRKEK